MSEELEVGKVYKVFHRRKGGFTARIKSLSDDWVEMEIVEGVAEAMLDYNVKYTGETLKARQAFCTFTELEAESV